MPNGDREFCNGIDDDCDGVIDEAADLEMPDDFCGERGGCANGTCIQPDAGALCAPGLIECGGGMTCRNVDASQTGTCG